jgi:hypothetical protein
LPISSQQTRRQKKLSNLGTTRPEVAFKIFQDLMRGKIVVGCVTCNTWFLNKEWKEYIALLQGDYFTPTKWYNTAAIHYCDNPTHEILSNRNPQGFNQSFNFTKQWAQQLEVNNISLKDFRTVCLEMKKQVEGLPI